MNYLYTDDVNCFKEPSEQKKYEEAKEYAKSNFVISSVYKSTLLENQMLAIALSDISKAIEDKEGSLIINLNVADIKRMLNKTGNSIYENLEKTAVGLVSGRTVGIINPEKRSFSYVSLITKAEYNRGIFSIRFAPEMKSFLKGLEKNYTILNRNFMLNFASVYSLRLYELLKSRCYYYKNKRKEEREDIFNYKISLSELKFKMGVINGDDPKIIKYLEKTGKLGEPDYDGAEELAKSNMYSRFGDFKLECLDPAINEINNKTDLHVTYKTERTGRGGKTTGLNFQIKLEKVKIEDAIKEENKSFSDDDFIDYMLDKLKKRIKISDIRKIAEVSGKDAGLVFEAEEKIKDIDNLIPDEYVDALCVNIEQLTNPNADSNKNTITDEHIALAMMGY